MWLFLTLASFVGFLTSLFTFIWRGTTRDGKFRRAGWPLLALTAACFAVWCFALPRVPMPYSREEIRGIPNLPPLR